MRPLVFGLLVAWWAYGSLLVVGNIGKPRKPTTPSSAVAILIVVTLQIAGVWYLTWGGR